MTMRIRKRMIKSRGSITSESTRIAKKLIIGDLVAYFHMQLNLVVFMPWYFTLSHRREGWRFPQKCKDIFAL